MSAHAALVALAAHATSTTTPPAAPAGQAAPVPGLTGTTFLLALLAFVAVMVLAGRAGALARLPLALVGAVASLTVGLAVAFGRGLVRTAARRLGFGWPQWCWLLGTLLLVGQAHRQGVPLRSAWAAAALGWATWLGLRVRAGWRWRRAPRLYAKAMRKTAQAMHANARTSAGRGAATKARAAADQAARASRGGATPPPAAPPTQPSPVQAALRTAREETDRFGVPLGARAPSQPSPSPLGFEPAWPRWLGGGRWRPWLGWRRGR
jgi:hypothetical protein